MDNLKSLKLYLRKNKEIFLKKLALIKIDISSNQIMHQHYYTIHFYYLFIYFNLV